MTSNAGSPGTSQRSTGVAPPGRVALLLAFLCIYVVWGSTYLAIRYAVETIPPLLVAGARHIIAGVVLFDIGLLSRLPPDLARVARQRGFGLSLLRFRPRQPALG